jgi:hypothetical protein
MQFAVCTAAGISVCKLRPPPSAKGAGHRTRLPLARTMLSQVCNAMKDLIFICITVVFFGGAWLYTRACERL